MTESNAKKILTKAVKQELLTEEQAQAMWRLRQSRKQKEGVAPPVEELAVAMGYLDAEDAKRLRVEVEKLDVPRELGGFRLLEKIASGGMGTVYMAKQISLDRVVAVKVLSPKLAEREMHVELFLREARTVGRLNHPNVISGIDVGEQDGVRYFVMEYGSGTSAAKLLERGGAFDEARVADIAMQIGRGLQHAHEAGMVHRDVKPGNILLTKDGIAKLCDLGLARVKPGEGQPMGTPAYISPEQAKGQEDVDIRSDLYSFGATLYHMLVGHPPFTGGPQIVMVKHVGEQPTPLREIDPDISEGMARIVAKLMQKERKLRHQTPRELLRDLEHLRETQLQEARKPRAPQSTKKKKTGRPRRRR
ncbi:MAG: serine/threonine-protein kinase [Planctomycetota bacterium]|jgi:serine/threonine-protein kinase